jgi:hypothetical protein
MAEKEWMPFQEVREGTRVQSLKNRVECRALIPDRKIHRVVTMEQVPANDIAHGIQEVQPDPSTSSPAACRLIHTPEGRRSHGDAADTGRTPEHFRGPAP